MAHLLDGCRRLASRSLGDAAPLALQIKRDHYRGAEAIACFINLVQVVALGFKSGTEVNSPLRKRLVRHGDC